MQGNLMVHRGNCMQYTAPALHCAIPGPAGSFDYTRGDSDLRTCGFFLLRTGKLYYLTVRLDKLLTGLVAIRCIKLKKPLALYI